LLLFLFKFIQLFSFIIHNFNCNFSIFLFLWFFFLFLKQLMMNQRILCYFNTTLHTPSPSNESSCMHKLSICHLSSFIQFLSSQPTKLLINRNSIFKWARAHWYSLNSKHLPAICKEHKLDQSLLIVFILNWVQMFLPRACLLHKQELPTFVELFSIFPCF
jgi:hypothetical protein